jgi:hypothetical protein
MPITYTLDRERQRMVTRAEGLLTRAELEHHLDVEALDRAEAFAELFDATGATTDITAQDVRGLVDRARQWKAAGISVGPTAIVATTDVVYGMARMYAMMAEFLNAPVEVFRETGPALEWLDRVAPPARS